MIANIIDHRKRPHRWKRVQAIIEDVEHDNCVNDADQAEPTDPSKSILCDMRDGLSITQAIEWASAVDCPVTLYLYDEGTNQPG